MDGGRLARRAPLLAVLLAGAVLRFATLGQQSLWLDEAVTGRLMRMGFVGMLRRLPGGESTPPAYYVLEWVWTRAFGTGEVGLRSLSALVGTLTVPVVYAAGARLLDRRAGLAVAALAAFSPLLVWYSQEARSYALLVALCAASLWAMGAALDPGTGRRGPAVWVATAGLALATHYFAVFVIVPECVWLIRARGRAAGGPAVAAVALVGAVLAPLALHQRARGGAAFIAATPLGTRLVQAAKQLVVGYDAPGELALTVGGAGLVVGLAWLLGWSGGGPPRGRALGLLGVAAAAVAVPVALAVVGLDYVITRNLIAAWVPAALALVAGASLAGGRAGPALVAGLCAVGLVATLGTALDGRYQRDDWRAAARTLPGPGASALVVTPASGRIPLAYYLPAGRPLPPGGAPVTWVEVIGLGARGIGAPVRSPPLPSAPPGLAGFDSPVAIRRATFSVLRYRASGPPVVVTPSMLAPLALAGGSGGPATILTRVRTK